MTNPLMAKNTSTPTEPPGSRSGRRWQVMTAPAATARSPSTPALRTSSGRAARADRVCGADGTARPRGPVAERASLVGTSVAWAGGGAEEGITATFSAGAEQTPKGT
ncbi:hypothetical protein GCM10009872_26900 [Actinopolymorpha rutila]